MRHLLAVVLLLTCLAGCGAPPPRVDWRDEAVSVAYPEPYQHLFLREVTVTDVSDVDTRVPACERFPLDHGVAVSVLNEALSGLGIFKEVTVVGPKGVPADDDGFVLDVALDSSALLHTGETG